MVHWVVRKKSPLIVGNHVGDLVDWWLAPSFFHTSAINISPPPQHVNNNTEKGRRRRQQQQQQQQILPELDNGGYRLVSKQLKQTRKRTRRRCHDRTLPLLLVIVVHMTILMWWLVSTSLALQDCVTATTTDSTSNWWNGNSLNIQGGDRQVRDDDDDNNDDESIVPWNDDGQHGSYDRDEWSYDEMDNWEGRQRPSTYYRSQRRDKHRRYNNNNGGRLSKSDSWSTYDAETPSSSSFLSDTEDILQDEEERILQALAKVDKTTNYQYQKEDSYEEEEDDEVNEKPRKGRHGGEGRPSRLTTAKTTSRDEQSKRSTIGRPRRPSLASNDIPDKRGRTLRYGTHQHDGKNITNTLEKASVPQERFQLTRSSPSISPTTTSASRDSTQSTARSKNMGTGQHSQSAKVTEPTTTQVTPPTINPSSTIQVSATTTTATATTSSITSPWIRQFLASSHRDVLLPVPTDYILDHFNVAQLAPVVERIAAHSTSTSMNDNDDDDNMLFSKTGILRNGIGGSIKNKNYPIYRQALQLIVHDTPISPEVAIPEQIDRAARALYLLIHQRYVISPRGLDMVRRRFLLHALSKASSTSNVDPIFGRCPSMGCRGMPLLPYGDAENYRSIDSPKDSVQFRCKRYCGSCGHLFYHWDSKVDGCAWGPSFCHLFLMTCGAEVFEPWKRRRFQGLQMGSPVEVEDTNAEVVGERVNQGTSPLVGRIFGFRLHPQANPVAKH